MTLQNKSVLITGASGGLGNSLAQKFLEKGYNIFFTGRNVALLKELYNTLQKNNKFSSNIEYDVCDFNNSKDVLKFIKTVKDRFKNIDILVNCAGVFPITPFKNTTIEEYNTCMQINVTAPYLLMKEFSKEMISNKWGRIINILSSSAYAGSPSTSIYCASKHALLGMSRALYKELKNDNVRVICVSPGSIKTKMGEVVGTMGQDYNTFIDPTELADYIVYNTELNDNLISEEIRLNRVFIQ